MIVSHNLPGSPATLELPHGYSIDSSKLHALNFTEQQNAEYRAAVKKAAALIRLSDETRFKIAGIYLELHRHIFGNENYFSDEGKILLSMFANDLGYVPRSIKNWIDVRLEFGVDIEVKSVTYAEGYEALQYARKRALTPQAALETVRELKADPIAARVNFMLRYSSELLNSCRKYRGEKNLADIEEVRHRIRECLKLLELP